MSGNWTLFQNNQGSGSGSADYVRDAFQDITLPATSNSGFSSTILNNPLGYLFANDDLPRYGAKQLWVKDLVLISDRSKWVFDQPTYEIMWDEVFPQVKGYAWGNITLQSTINGAQILVNTSGGGVAFSGIVRRGAFVVDGDTATAATATATIDSASPATVDFSTLASGSAGIDIRKAITIALGSSLAGDNSIHTFALAALQNSTLKVNGVIAYFENSGGNVSVDPGTTYVDKTKVTTAVGATFALPSFGSSLGGNALIFRASNGGATYSALSASSPASFASGSSGTNLVDVSTGQGASFPAGSVVATSMGTSYYIGLVTNVSTDTLTVSPTLSFGLSAPIYQAWLNGASYAISATTMRLSQSIVFDPSANNASFIMQPQYDGDGKWAFFSSNVGVTTVAGVPSARFFGASGFFQIDGYFSALSYEVVGSGIFHADVYANGLSASAWNSGQTGIVLRSAMTNAGPGWNSVVIAAGASLGATMGISRINLYQRNFDIGVSFGRLAEFDTMQAYSNRTAINATLMALGTYRRAYADQMYFKGPWERLVGASFPGGAAYVGSTTTCSFTRQYYGEDFAILGTPGGVTMTLDGVGIGASFNLIRSAGGASLHSVVVNQVSATTIIHAFDYLRSRGDLNDLVTTEPLADTSAPAESLDPTFTEYLTAGTTTHTFQPDTDYAIVDVLGGGGGGSGSGTAGWGNGSNGGDSYLRIGSTDVVLSQGGGGAVGGANNGGTSNSGVISPPAIKLEIVRGTGGMAPGVVIATGGTVTLGGGPGGTNGAGGPVQLNSGNIAGGSAEPNTGAGGQGGGTQNSGAGNYAGGGGAAGARCRAIVRNVAGQTWNVQVGSAGSGGAAGTNGQNGGNGGTGRVGILEFPKVRK